MRKIYLITLMLLSFNCIQAQTVLLTENFDYPAGDSLRNNGWFSHSAPTNNPIRITSGGLSFSNYLGSGIGNAAAVNNNGSDENRPFSSYIDSGDIYVSFLARVNSEVTSANTGYFLHIGAYLNQTSPAFESISTAFRARTFKAQGSTPAKFRFGLTFNAASLPTTPVVGVNVTNDLDTGVTYLVVIKYRFYSGVNNDSVSMYVFGAGDSIATEPTIPSVGPVGQTLASGNPTPDMTIGQYVALRQYNAGQRVTVDGIIAQTSWNISSIVGGVNDLNQENSFSIYPNPAQDRINIQWGQSNSGTNNVKIVNSLGQLMFQKTIDHSNELESTLMLPELANGIYSVLVERNGNRSRMPLLISK